MKTSRCPQCGRAFHYDPAAEPAWLPFCCQRCQWVDLGRWMSGDYLVSRSLLRDNDEQED
ncbi:MAG: DNA gyrase inhibitor YacG [Planctomycetes bacterium]|nr:DNA gyrase inhibitor YacG [Planctomycetota bacterium]